VIEKKHYFHFRPKHGYDSQENVSAKGIIIFILLHQPSSCVDLTNKALILYRLKREDAKPDDVS